ncbi:hypothetical protein L1276_002066 [Flavobacterium sp. HSC-32F16]|uniref:hypothetical protein n=1 Tax=Flavobacterium sp. HSC-32F16 TaxID=2910964 RepID=UPI0020A5364C|nr:hypothetical protein [Flavobacterium sp. HSC-32F16]MCP2026922.1 hypothetical protein [Flavobacterium sp. HSC-32F16]
MNNKIFLIVLSVSLGTTLFSCQNKDEKEQKIEDTQAVSNPVVIKSVVVDETQENKDSSVKIVTPPVSSQKVDVAKFSKTNENNELKSNTLLSTKTEKTNASSKKEIKETALNAPTQINAEFPGGIDQFYTFFGKEFKKPESVNYWKLNLKLAFAVEKNGSVSFLECSPAIEEPLEKEIIRVLNSCPKWQPGESNGKKIRMQYSLPIFLHNTQ